MKKALITGHAGFIGSHLFKALNEHGWAVTGADLKTGQDIRDMDLPKVDMCFHLAAQSNAHSTAFYEDATHNIMATLRLLQKYEARVVFASSAAIHQPFTSYALSKWTSEHYCRIYEARIVRMCNITGPGGHGVFEKFAAAERLRIAGTGDQMRAYAPVRRAVDLFIKAAASPPGSLHLLPGVEMSVLDIADIMYPHKPRDFVEQVAADLPDIR